ncbi:rCG57218 [Rattus norvegicus]|uniref:RCG57218 n=1 Tax=Rattus norvegicus TaxID=10116 RepID=A6KPL8_RAT|nr:rCG57218 [Rattus norvegicus]
MGTTRPHRQPKARLRMGSGGPRPPEMESKDGESRNIKR